jgi:hypothetical protein
MVLTRKRVQLVVVVVLVLHCPMVLRQKRVQLVVVVVVVLLHCPMVHPLGLLAVPL